MELVEDGAKSHLCGDAAVVFVGQERGILVVVDVACCSWGVSVREFDASLRRWSGCRFGGSSCSTVGCLLSAF